MIVLTPPRGFVIFNWTEVVEQSAQGGGGAIAGAYYGRYHVGAGSLLLSLLIFVGFVS